MITPFFFLSLFFFLLVRADDLQETLVNRNMRAIGPVLFRSQINQQHHFLAHELSGNFIGFVPQGACANHDNLCVFDYLAENPSSDPGQGFCITDSDCTWRLGTLTQSANQNLFDQQAKWLADGNVLLGTTTLAVGGNSFDNSIPVPTQNPDYFANRVLNYYQIFKTDGSRSNVFPDCGGYVNDSTAGFECVFDSFTFFDNSNANFNNYYLYQTAVGYPDLRCISGRCVHFNDSFPGYGKDYCLNQYSTNSRPQGQCPIPGMNCGTAYQPPDNNLFGSIFTEYLPFTPFQESNLGVVEPRNSKASFVFDPDSSGNPPTLAYSSDPRDQVSTCSCTHDSQCGGMKCLQGQCYCVNSTQCLFHSSGPQVCLTNAAVIQGSGQSAINVGSCSCVVGSSESCNYNGMCTSLQQAFQRTPSDLPTPTPEVEYGFSTYYSVDQYALGATKTPTSAGRCECFGKLLAGRTWNETVVGNACETDALRDTLCSGHGKPVCGFIIGATPAISLNRGGQIGTYCSQANFLNRGQQSCICDIGYGPDVVTVTNGVITNPCTVPIPCAFASLSGAGVEVNGVCECSGDFFQALTVPQLEVAPDPTDPTKSGVCVPDCSLIKSNGRGICFYNVKHLPTVYPGNSVAWTSVIPYNNDVECLIPGWLTLYSPALDSFQYFDICYKCTVSSPPTQPYPYVTLEGPEQLNFCNVPYNYITQPLGSQGVCGLGSLQASGGCKCSDFTCTCVDGVCADGPGIGHSCDLSSRVLDHATPGNVISLYQPQYPIPYCAASCLALTQNMADPATPNEFNNVQPQICGGPVRGTCISDGVGGSKCLCNPGYSGLVCQHAICARSRGRMCSNNGICDSKSGFCVCSIGFIGIACEFRSTDCGNSQTVLSLPLPDDSLVDY